jgi:hypothetical protein
MRLAYLDYRKEGFSSHHFLTHPHTPPMGDRVSGAVGAQQPPSVGDREDQMGFGSGCEQFLQRCSTSLTSRR